MRRRDFIALFSSAATWPLAAGAQQPVVGFLCSSSRHPYTPFLDAFHQGLKEAGFVEGQNVAMEYRWAEGQFDRLQTLAADLVLRQVALIFAGGGGVTALAAKAATSTIPIVFANGSDPVKLGIVASLNRPGGNITGVSFFSVELGPKHLELLRELSPKSTAIGFVMNPRSPNAPFDLPTMQAAARTLGQQLIVVNASSEQEIDTAFAALVQQQVAALVIHADPFFVSRRDQLAALAVRHKVPSIFNVREYAATGGLMSYGTSVPDGHRQAGIYVGRILKGAKPEDLPVVQSTRFELVVNLKTANALGLTIPATLLARADEVIE